jgi:MFS family permease
MKIAVKGIPSNVIILGLVSFFTDAANDMIYPLLPVFLTQYLGASKSFVGLIEGAAECITSLLTLFSGIWADKAKDRAKIVLGGYSLSLFFKPLVALAHNPWTVFFIRCVDRVGKGIRTSPRDALIADSVPEKDRGRAYGLQRAFDNLGAVAGPLIATLLLTWFIKDLRQLFLIAFIPGMLAVGLIIWKVREVRQAIAPSAVKEKIGFKLPEGKLRVYLSILFLFLLSSSSDAFLLLRAGELGIATAALPLVWMVFNLVKALTNYPCGILSDRFGRRRTILAGWIIYSVVYFLFAGASKQWHAWILFAIYGLFYGLTEGSERAIMADYSHLERRGQMFGWYYLVTGISTLTANLLFGFMWQHFDSRMAFLTGGTISALACICLLIFLLKVPTAAKNEKT